MKNMNNAIQIIYGSKNWKELETKLFTIKSPKERGLVFEWFCVFYLRTQPIYLANYKRVLHSSEFLAINEIKHKLGLKNIEQGTDIIGERYDDKIDIIQCKFKDKSNINVSAKDINDPIRIASGREAQKWVDTVIICANCKGFTRNKTLEELELQFRTILSGDFSQLTSEDFKNIHSSIENEIPIYAPKSPRSHQLNAVKKTVSHFTSQSRGQIIHACGTGKTLTSYFIYRELKSDLTLYVVPSLQLIRQTLHEWTRESLADESLISPFVVCSDKTNEKIGENDPALWLQELGIKVSNEKNELDLFINSSRSNKVIFATYQSAKILTQNLRELNRDIDFAFFDEAHNTVTSKTKLFSHLLFDENIKIQKRLFLTATPKKLNITNNKLSSMDNFELYGDIIDEITVKDAIENLKLLNDYKIITKLIDHKGYAALLDENPFVSDDVNFDKEIELKLISSAYLMKKLFSDKNLKNVVSFHSRKNRASAFKKILGKVEPDISTYYVHGKQSGSERHSILDDFSKNTPSLVANARCLSEGVNVPSIDGIIFVDPKQSKIDITQAIGRALRKGNTGKGDSYIILPILIDHLNPESIAEAYQEILIVLRSMAEHDGRIVEYFRLVREGKKPIREMVEIDSEYLTEHIDLIDFEEKLNYKAWDKLSRLGRRPWEQARAWARTLEINSSEWRKLVKKKELPLDIPSDPPKAYSKEWIDWRDFLGNPSEKEEMDQFIKEYKSYAVGKINPVPQNRTITDSGYMLGNKVRSIRNSYKKNILPEWKKSIIEKELISFDLFTWESKDDLSWKLHFEAYKDYVEKTGIQYPPKNTIQNRLRIETWFYNELKRIGNNSERKSHTKWQLDLLEKINFPKQGKQESEWEKMYELVSDLYVTHKGKIPDIDPDTGKIYMLQGKGVKRWISKQRDKYKKGNLSIETIAKLERIKGWAWDPFYSKFLENFDTMIDYIKETGDSNPPQKTVYRGKNIGRFLTKIRSGIHDDKISDEMEEQLKLLGTNLKPTKKIGSVYYYD